MIPEFKSGNKIQLLENGTEFFPALIATIDSARAEIHLETYIFSSDVAARSVVDSLIRARQRDVAVRILVDGFGARDFTDELGRDAINAGCEVMVYRAEAPTMRFRRNRLRRLHRKLAVVDGRVAFVGGINIIGDLTDTAPDFPRQDYAVIVEGPVVADIHFTVRHVWRLVRWATLGRRPHAPPPQYLDCGPQGTMRAAFLIRDNLAHRRDIENAYLAAINDAHHEVIIACAYFLPGRHFRKALTIAAKRGVNVTLLLQSRGDHPLIRNAERLLYNEFLQAGIKVVEYQTGFLHAKVGISDGRWATVGSSNIDPFSLLLAREANVVIEDAEFAATLRRRLLHAITAGGQEVSIDNVKNRSLWERLVSRFAYVLIRFAISVSRYAGDYRQ